MQIALYSLQLTPLYLFSGKDLKTIAFKLNYVLLIGVITLFNVKEIANVMFTLNYDRPLT